MAKKTATANAGRRLASRKAAKIRRAILDRMGERGLNMLNVATLAKVPRSVVYEFLGPKCRDITLSSAEKIWRAVGFDVTAIDVPAPAKKTA